MENKYMCVKISFTQVWNGDEKMYEGNKVDKGNILEKLNKKLQSCQIGQSQKSETSPQAKRHKLSLLSTSLAI